MTSPTLDHCYVKNLSLLNLSDSSGIRELVFQEERVYEVLIKTHPNVTTYFGCKQEGYFITEFCFERYKGALHDRITEKGVGGISRTPGRSDFSFKVSIPENDFYGMKKNMEVMCVESFGEVVLLYCRVEMLSRLKKQ